MTRTQIIKRYNKLVEEIENYAEWRNIEANKEL